MPHINPHDRFFRHLFSDPEKARLFLRTVLPEDLIANLDLDSLEYEQESHVKPDLRARFSDLIIRTRFTGGQDARVYILMEHKSVPDPGVWLQILEYELELWKKDRTAGRILTLVIPLVFYHGERRWTVPVEFQEQFTAPDAALPFLPNFRHILFDTAGWKAKSTPELRGNVFLLTGLMLMKHARRGELQQIQKIIALWRDLGYINTDDEFVIQLSYIFETRDITLTELSTLVETTLANKEAIMPTLADRLREEGKIKGFAEGEKNGILLDKQETLIRLMSRKFGIEEQEKARINTCTDRDKLTAALDAILDAADPEEVLGLLG